MKKLLLAAALAPAVLFASASFAADLPGRGAPASPGPVFSPIQAYNWTGVYAGVNAGYGWGKFQRGAEPLIGGTSGGTIGGTLGYNYQMGSLLLGVEGDLNKSWERGGRNFVGPISTKGSMEWFGTLRRPGAGLCDRRLRLRQGQRLDQRHRSAGPVLELFNPPWLRSGRRH